MREKPSSIRVTEIRGEIARYRVASAENPSFPHLVDLLENNGNGECDCRDFITRCNPNWKRLKHTVEYGWPGHPNPDRTICKHIHVARKKFTQEILKELSRQHRHPS